MNKLQCYFVFYLEFKVSVDSIKGTCASETPKHLTSGSVGSDLFSTKNYLIHSCKSTLIECRLHMKLPRGYFGLISGRSSLALKGITTHVGVVDNDYAGSICVVLTNVACYPTYKIDKGDRIAQITLVKCDRAHWKEVKDFEMENYGDKLRVGGFGSTGK